MSESQNNNPNQGGQGGSAGDGSRNNNRRRRYRNNRSGGGQNAQDGNQNQPINQNRQPQTNEPRQNRPENRGQQQSQNRNRRPGGRVLTSNQVLVKYDNLLEQHLITRRKYFEYFNRVDYRQLKKLEYNFYDSVEHLRRFEDSLETWQREVLEKRKTERYKLDLTYSLNRGLDPSIPAEVEVAPEDIHDPHYKESQYLAYQEYKDDTEESSGTLEDYLKVKGLT